MIIGINQINENKFSIANVINEAIVRILSAVGSAILPNFVIKLYFLAIYPSKKSVKLARLKNISAIILDDNEFCNKK